MFLILVCVLIATIFYFKVVKVYDYWPSKGVKQRKQVYLLGDNASTITRKNTFWDLILKMYNSFPEERYMGFYNTIVPKLLIRDPDLIKQLTIKDFDHFIDRTSFIPAEADPLWSRNLFALSGEPWREMRSILSPSFTTSKMKMIYKLISDCTNQFSKHFLEKEQNVLEVELKDIFSRYTNDVIGSTAFGIECDSLKEPENEFYLMGKEACKFDGFRNVMKFICFAATPQLAKGLGLKLFSENVRTFFTNLIKETMKIREEKEIVRPDMLQLLIDVRKAKSQHKPGENTGSEMTDLDITAQALVFFFAGFESVSTSMCYLGYELALNPNIQQKLYEEIDETFNECDENVTYEVLTKMKYLDMVVSEVLRKWPPTLIFERTCVKPYTIQPIKPDEKPVHLQKGDLLWFSISGLHRDPKYFPNPDEFDPERFSDKNKSNINPYVYLPFGSGPRNCIGSRFAILEIKALFFNLLRYFEFVRIEKTQVPLVLKKSSILLLPEGGFWVGLKRRK